MLYVNNSLQVLLGLQLRRIKQYFQNLHRILWSHCIITHQFIWQRWTPHLSRNFQTSFNLSLITHARIAYIICQRFIEQQSGKHTALLDKPRRSSGAHTAKGSKEHWETFWCYKKTAQEATWLHWWLHHCGFLAALRVKKTSRRKNCQGSQRPICEC